MTAGNAIAPWIVVTGLDGSGKTSLTYRLVERHGGHLFRLPYHEFVKQSLKLSGHGTPFGDVHTDRLIFAADARLTNYLIRAWRRQYRRVVSQRGWMDNFIFAAVQGESYTTTAMMLRPEQLETASAMICLTADPQVAFERIQHDPSRDKYETIEFIRAQHRETARFFAEVRSNASLSAFERIPAVMIDTTSLTIEQVYARAVEFLRGQGLLGD